MSQGRRQNHPLNISIPPFPANVPGSVQPSELTSSPSSTSDQIPRDYLELLRPDKLTNSQAGAAAFNPRKSSPSPLHTKIRPNSPGLNESDRSWTPSSQSQSTNPAQPPRQPTINRIAHAAFPTPPSSVSPNSSSAQRLKLPSGSQQHEREMRERTNGSQSRKNSDTTASNRSAVSSPVSSINSLPSMPGERTGVGQRTMPRNSSIDSAISSLSSASQSHKPSFDASTLSQTDIGNLIATAGSAEAVIIHLLKEKHHVASQNSQLWKLVDKQRTLILGLNKDLERSLKEKERYKKKLKEVQNSEPPPLPSMNSQAGQYRALQDIAQTTSEDARQGRTEDQAIHQRNIDPGAQDSSVGSQCAPVSSNKPKHNINTLQKPTMNDMSSETNKEPSAATAMEEPEQPSQAQSSQPLMYARKELSTESPSSITSSSPALNEHMIAEENQRSVLDPAPARKHPPAPLNLSQASRTFSEQPEVYDSESEYEDVLAVDELPVERGRRKTRDDDDRERETALVKEKIPHGLSRGEGSQEITTGSIGSSEVTNARPPSQPPGAESFSERADARVPSLSPRVAHAALPDDHPIITGPKSPGLPMSPRPEDRPIGSPLPRMPRDIPNSLGSLPVSSRGDISGLALSTRVGDQDPFMSSDSSPATVMLPTSIDAANRPIPSIDATVKIDSPRSLPSSKASGIYQGLVSEDYPNLLFPPNALPLIRVQVSSSRLRPSRNSYMASRPTEEEPVFTLGVYSRSENVELWRVEKVIAALPQLDQQVKQLSAFSGRLPDRSIFSGHSPAKVDTRRAALNSYFEALLDTPMDERAALAVCQFLTSDAIEARDDETSLLNGGLQLRSEVLRGPDGKPRKEGYLTKRGKNFGGWKARYFVLHGPELKYYESPGGPHLGTIKIHHAQIGKQSQNRQNNSPSRMEDDSDNQYRHAFLILEPKKKDSSALVRHVLCAESDEERDTWVEALLEYVEGQLEADTINPNPPPLQIQSQLSKPTTPSTPAKSKPVPSGSKKNNKGTENVGLERPGTVQGFSFDDAVPAEPPVFGPSFDQQAPRSPLITSGLPVDASDPSQVTSPILEHKVISGPTNGAVIQDAGAWGNKVATSTKEKKRSIWGFRTRSSFDLASQIQASNDPPTTPIHANTPGFSKEFVRPVFGMPLAEAVQFCAPLGVDVHLPAVAYRCIEYLTAKGAESEEGIFRLSGSNVVVKGLKERFNTEGDVDFLAGDQYYDVHAVASLFKQYLRELPTTVLTRELHLEFLRVLELPEKQNKIWAFNSLVHRLPKPNLTLLRALVQFLIVIVSNSDINKMTVRNVGIVFAPTLNIPAPVFSMFLTDYEDIFEDVPSSGPRIVEQFVDHSVSPEDIRSPRRQVLSDLPMRACHETDFRRHLVDPHDGLNTQQDVGFTSMQPNYERSSGNAPDRFSQSRTNSSPVYRALAPNPENPRSAKAKRRESSFLFMDLDRQNQPPAPSNA